MSSTPTSISVPKRPWDRTRITTLFAVLSVLTSVVISLRVVQVNPITLVNGLANIRNLFGRMLPMEFPAITDILGPLADTIMIAIVGTAFAGFLSVPLGFLAARTTTPARWIRGLARSTILGARAVPDLLYALLLVRALGVGVLPGVLAIAFYSTGMIGRLFADAIEEIDGGVQEAVAAVGGTRLQTNVAAVVPQVMPSFVSITLYRFDVNVASSVVLGFVGAGGIGFELHNALRTLQYERGLGLALLVVALVIAVERLSAGIRAGLVSGERDGPRSTRRRSGKHDRLSTRLAWPSDRLRSPWSPTRLRRVALAWSIVTVVILSSWGLRISAQELLAFFPAFIGEIGDFLPPSFSSVNEEITQALLQTFAIGISATFFATLLSLPLAFLAARNAAPAAPIYYAARYFIVVVRGIPPLVLAIIFVSALGLGAFAGTLALAVSSIGLSAKLMADAVEHIRAEPCEAVRATGATRMQESLAAIVPQVAPSFVSTALFTLDSAIRSSLILGIVGAGGIGFLIYQTVYTLQFESTSALLIVVFVTVLLLERVSDFIRSRLLWSTDINARGLKM
jgi:phosphonate transport system permease protein